MVEKIKWKLYLRWSVTKYRLKTAKLKRKTFFTRIKTALIKTATAIAERKEP